MASPSTHKNYFIVNSDWCVFQAERLSEFYEVCKSVYVGRGDRFVKIEQVSFFHTCFEYLFVRPFV